jgi:hypothetical protein
VYSSALFLVCAKNEMGRVISSLQVAIEKAQIISINIQKDSSVFYKNHG